MYKCRRISRTTQYFKNRSLCGYYVGLHTMHTFSNITSWFNRYLTCVGKRVRFVVVSRPTLRFRFSSNAFCVTQWSPTRRGRAKRPPAIGMRSVSSASSLSVRLYCECVAFDIRPVLAHDTWPTALEGRTLTQPYDRRHTRTRCLRPSFAFNIRTF